MADGATETTPRRVAIYGGSFNPPHVGHVLCATLALCSGDFDEVRLLPVADHAFGKTLVPLATRTRLTAAAVAHLGPRVTVDPVEGDLPAPNYTVNTIAHLLAASPTTEFTLVMGADSWAARHRWHDWTRLEAMVGGRILVVGRAGVVADDAPPVDFTLPDISSTDVRRRIKDGEPYWWLVPEAVAEAIEAEGLYR